MWDWVAMTAIAGCVASFVFGLVKRYPWGILQSNLLNGALIGPCVIGLVYGAYQLLIGGGLLWTLLIVPAGLMLVIAVFNLSNSAKEARELVDRLRSDLAEQMSEDE